MPAVTFDTFKFIRRLKDAGLPENQAEAISDVIQEAHSVQLEELATKRDIKDLDTKIDTKVKELEYRMTIRLGLMMMGVAGMLFTALRYFPPPQPVVISGYQGPAMEQGMGRTPVNSPPVVSHPTP
ncbi:MAG: hypothetical protein HQL87_08390 [Magnetococcales bacterium]|nr:hypothetical protein [Magnetococcales bacterium]